MRGARTATSIAWLATLAGCPAPAPGPPATPSAPPVIEASIEAQAAAGPAPIGQGDPEAQRCLSKLEAASTSRPCRRDDPATCAAHCRDGDPGACRTLAQAIDDEGCRAKLRALACERDELAACADLADQLRSPGHADTDATAPDQPATDRARELARQACDGDYARGCRILGQLSSDADEAVTHFDRACELGDAEGCVAAANRYNGGSSPDRTLGAERLKRACELGHADACVDLALAHIQGQGVQRDPLRARQLLERICSLDGEADGGRSCLYLANYAPILGGSSGPPIPSEALFERACDKGQLDACAWVAQRLYGDARYDDAIAVANQVLAKRADSWAALYARGISRFDKGLHAAAAEDLRALCPLRADWAYCPLWLYAAQERAGEDGEPALQRHLGALASTDWPEPVYRFFLGKIGERQLLVAARDPEPQRQREKECEAYYYIGQKHLFDGRKARAEAMFQKVVDTGITNFVEYLGAEAELARMGVKPRSP